MHESKYALEKYRYIKLNPFFCGIWQTNAVFYPNKQLMY